MDDADRAGAFIEQDLQHAIDAVTQRPKGNQVIDAGQILCTECWIPILQARLDAIPHATRCVQCQDINDRYNS